MPVPRLSFTPTLRRLASVAVLAATLGATPAFAVNKDMVQLQTQVQSLMDAVARLQQSNDERMGVLRDLVQQTVDSVNKMSVTVGALQTKLSTESDAAGGKADQLSGQMQALNDSVDELKARLGRMEKQLSDVQSQAAQANAALSNLPGASGGSAAPSSVPPSMAAPPAPVAPSSSAPSDAAPSTSTPPPSAASAGPAAPELYRQALSDYMQAKYPLATGEFQSLIKAYPDDNLSGNAFFYLGEIDQRSDKPTQAIKHYDEVLERYPDNSKIPAAHLHKAQAMLALKQTDSGIRELRALLNRYPNSPEAAQAKTRLAALGATRR